MIESYKKLLIIVPAYNEEECIASTIQGLQAQNLQDIPGIDIVSIIVINDSSLDRTREMAIEAGAKVVSLPYNLGIGGAVQTGMIYAQRNKYDFAVQVDGDNQHDACYIKALLEPIISDGFDMVIGSRFLPPFVGYRSSFIRRIGIHFFSALISLLTRYRITDPTSGFRAFNKNMIEIFSEYYPHDYPEPEVIAIAGRYGAKVKEVPVEMRERNTGHSSIRYLKTMYYMIKVTLALLLDQVKKRKGDAL